MGFRVQGSGFRVQGPRPLQSTGVVRVALYRYYHDLIEVMKVYTYHVDFANVVCAGLYPPGGLRVALYRYSDTSIM